MNFQKTLCGMLTVELTSADPEKILSVLTQKQIPLFRVEKKQDLTYRLVIHRRDYRAIGILTEKQGDSLRILGERGLYWKIKSFCSRPVLLCLLLLLLISSWYLPTRIFFVTVEGNDTIPERWILAAAEDCGIRFGVSRRKVRSEKMKNALLSAVPQLQWAGINTAGCTAVISVRERVPEEAPRETGIVSSLVSDHDAYILSATVTGGTARVVPGQTVTKGQVLISGYTDCGICIRASRAEGEILAQTSRTISALMPETYLTATDAGETEYRISLLIGKKRINFWKDSRISDMGCGRMYTEYYLSLPGGFRLPVAVCIDRFQPYVLQKTKLLPEDARTMLQDFSESYLKRQMVAGQMVEGKQHLSCEEGYYLLESTYVCTEIIGREQREQIGVINEQGN